MSAHRLFVDTSVLAYAVGEAHVQRAPARALAQAATEGRVTLHASVEAIQELLHHRMRRIPRATAVAEATDCADLCRLHAFDLPVVRRLIELVATTDVRGRDAVHAATAQSTGFSEIVSADTDFDRLPGLARIPLESALARLE